MRRPKKVSAPDGVTLLEILLAMLILGLVTAGIFTAFVFSRQVSYRSEGELIVQGWTQRIADELRLVVGGDRLPSPTAPNEDCLGLTPGIYIDPDYQFPPGADPHPCGTLTPVPCNDQPLPPGVNIRRLATTSPLRIPADLRTKYGLRWRYYVEDHVPVSSGGVDADCDGETRGRDFDEDNQVDLRWTRIVVDWTPPNS